MNKSVFGSPRLFDGFGAIARLTEKLQKMHRKDAMVKTNVPTEERKTLF